MGIWAKHDLENHMPHIRHLGSLCPWLKEADNEIRMVREPTREPNMQASRGLQPITHTEYTEVSWQRRDVGLEYDGVRLPPIVPNRSCAMGRPACILIPMGILRKKNASFPNGVFTADCLPRKSEPSKGSKEEILSHAD